MNGKARPYLNPYVAGALLGTLLFLSFFITGGGLGASAGLNRVQVAVLDILAPGHVDRVGYMAEMAGGTRNPLNNSTVFLLLGSVLGGALSGWLNGRFKLEIRKGPHISNAPVWCWRLSAALLWFTAPAWPGAALLARP